MKPSDLRFWNALVSSVLSVLVCCLDVNECAIGFHRCGPNSVCVNLVGSYRCECRSGYEFADDRHTCVCEYRNPVSLRLEEAAESHLLICVRLY